MGYFVAYVVDGEGGPRDGPPVATGAGWLAWSEWAEGQDDRHPEAAHLAREGWLEPAAALDELEHELEQLLHEPAPENVLPVTSHLLAAVRDRPGNCAGLLVTDGTPGGDEDDEEEE